MTKLDITAVLATYNGSLYIRQQVESILRQSKPPSEIIVVDDQSTDDTLDILHEYRQAGLHIYQNSENLGVQRSFSRAIGLVSTPYVALSDQDDVWQYEKLSELSEIIGRSDMAYSDASFIDESDVFLPGSLSETVMGYGRTFATDDFQALVFGSFVWGSTAIARTDLYQRYGPAPETFRNHDWWMTLSAALGAGVAYSPKRLTQRRIHGTNYSVSAKENLFVKMRRRLVNRQARSLGPQADLLKQLSQSNLPTTDIQNRFLVEAEAAYSQGPSLRLAAFSLANRNVIFPAGGTERLILAGSRLFI